MADYKTIYQDADIAIVSRTEYMQEDSVDEARTIVLKIGDKEFGFELTFGKLIHTWEK